VTFRVAVTGDFEKLALQAAPWSDLGKDAEVVAFHEPFASEQATVAALQDFDAITLIQERIPLTHEILEKLPRLKLIVFTGRKNETLDAAAALARNVTVCKCSPDFEVPPEAPGGKSPVELTFALLLSCTWQTGPNTSLIRQGGWVTQCGVALRGKSLGIVGYGSLGRPVGRIGLAFGMNVLAFGRSLTAEAAAADNVTRADLDTLLGQSDVISIHLPLNSATRGLIGAQQIGLMKPGAILINTARAAIVEEQPLIDALQSRKIAMAGLDVYWREPLPSDHPLTRLPNVVMTPHIGYATEEAMVLRYRELLRTLVAYREGNVVGRYVPEPI
jgi:phosphoglycerate dehydrogenase-like enzyme